MKISKKLSILGGFLGPAIACTHVHASGAALCASQEKVIFTCGVTNNKMVSLCGSSDAAQSYIEYRFGSKSAVELTFKASKATPDRIFHRAEVVYAGNAEDTIWFKNGQYTYSIFLPARGAPGLEVSRRGEIAVHLECKGGWGGVRGNPKLESRFIRDHGSSNPSALEQFGLGG